MNRKIYLKTVVCLLAFICCGKMSFAAPPDDYNVQVTFPAAFQIGDYIEFVNVYPTNAGASGYYEISISYTRGNIAAGATFLGSIAHAGAAIWREMGRINSNGYIYGSAYQNFTVDCNTEYGYPRFRIRAINTFGINADFNVDIKVRSISQNSGFTAINVTGNSTTVDKFLPMTNDWSLYVGNAYLSNGASLAIKATEDGNVGIGTATPTSKLAVNGNIRAKEVKVENANWPDYVFTKGYELPSLQSTEQHIKEKGHLPGIPSAAEVKANGVDLREMNAKLLLKIEELTLYLIDMKKDATAQRERSDLQIDLLKKDIEKLKIKDK